MLIVMPVLMDTLATFIFLSIFVYLNTEIQYRIIYLFVYYLQSLGQVFV